MSLRHEGHLVGRVPESITYLRVYLGSNFGSAFYWLCDLGELT